MPDKKYDPLTDEEVFADDILAGEEDAIRSGTSLLKMELKQQPSPGEETLGTQAQERNEPVLSVGGVDIRSPEAGAWRGDPIGEPPTPGEVISDAYERYSKETEENAKAREERPGYLPTTALRHYALIGRNDQELYEKVTGHKWVTPEQLSQLPAEDADRIIRRQSSYYENVMRDATNMKEAAGLLLGGPFAAARKSIAKGRQENSILSGVEDFGKRAMAMGTGMGAGAIEGGALFLDDPYQRLYDRPLESLGDLSLVGGMGKGALAAARMEGGTGAKALAYAEESKNFREGLRPTKGLGKAIETIPIPRQLGGDRLKQWLWDPKAGIPEETKRIMLDADRNEPMFVRRAEEVAATFDNMDDASREMAQRMFSDQNAIADAKWAIISDVKEIEELRRKDPQLFAETIGIAEDLAPPVKDLSALQIDELREAFLKKNDGLASGLDDMTKSLAVDFELPDGRSMNGLEFILSDDAYRVDPSEIRLRVRSESPEVIEVAEKMLEARKEISSMMLEYGDIVVSRTDDGKPIYMMSPDLLKANLGSYMTEKYDPIVLQKQKAMALRQEYARKTKGMQDAIEGESMGHDIVMDPETGRYLRVDSKDIGYSGPKASSMKHAKMRAADFATKKKYGMVGIGEAMQAGVVDTRRLAHKLKQYEEIAQDTSIAMDKNQFKKHQAMNPGAKGDFELLPDSKYPGTNINIYGDLGGKYVKKEVASTIKWQYEMHNTLQEMAKDGGTIAKVVGATLSSKPLRDLSATFKMQKVANSYVGHLHILEGNITNQLYDGGTPASLAIAAKRLSDHGSGKTDPFVSVLGGAGLFKEGGREIGDMSGVYRNMSKKKTIKSLLQLIQEETKLAVAERGGGIESYAEGGIAGLKAGIKQTPEAMRQAAESGPFFFGGHGGRMRAAFIAQENSSRLAIATRYIQKEALKRGVVLYGKNGNTKARQFMLDNPEIVKAAVDRADDLQLNYKEMPHLFQVTSKTGVTPFVSYQWKASGMYADLHATKPLATMLIREQGEHQKRYRSEAEEAISSTSPEYRAGALSIPLVDTETGDLDGTVLDVSRDAPQPMFTEDVLRKRRDKDTNPFRPEATYPQPGPPVGLLAQVWADKNYWGEKYKPGLEGAKDKAIDMAENFVTPQASSARRKVWPILSAWWQGGEAVDPSTGEPMDLGDAMASVLGIKFRKNKDPEEVKKALKKKHAEYVREVKWEYKRALGEIPRFPDTPEGRAKREARERKVAEEYQPLIDDADAALEWLSNEAKFTARQPEP